MSIPMKKKISGTPPTPLKKQESLYIVLFAIFLLSIFFYSCTEQLCSRNPSWRNGPFRLFSAQNRLFWGARGGPRNFFFIGIFIFLLLRSPCKKLKSYDKPLYGFEQRHQQEQQQDKTRRLITKNSGLRRFDETVCTAPLGPIGPQ